MERSRILTLLAGVMLGAALVAVPIAIYTLSSGLITQGPCNLEVHTRALNTTAGWFYRVEGARELRPLANYTVAFIIYAAADSYGNQKRIVEWQGPLPDLVGRPGNFSFDDRGIHAGRLDDSGDYFWSARGHNLEIWRAGELVGGTLGCA